MMTMMVSNDKEESIVNIINAKQVVNIINAKQATTYFFIERLLMIADEHQSDGIFLMKCTTYSK
jgi:hypothetical protein